jgi:hypothetical protein
MVFLCSVRRLLVAACVVPSLPIFVALMKEAPGSSETSVLQEPHGVTTQKTPFFLCQTVFLEIMVLLEACCGLMSWYLCSVHPAGEWHCFPSFVLLSFIAVSHSLLFLISVFHKK